MLNSFSKFFKSLERWEYYHPSSFWVCTISVYFCFTTLFSHLPSFPNNPSQAQVVIEEVRAGGQQQSEGPPKIPAPKPKEPPFTRAQKPKISEASAERIEKIRFRQPSGNPSGSGNDNFNDDIVPKEWENWTCPKPEEIISHPGF